jgi:hypothetical protein
MGANILAPSQLVESMSQLRFPVQTDRRLQELMDRNTDGLLSDREREELTGLVELSEQLSLVRAEALQLLKRRP